MRRFIGHVTSATKALYYPWANIGDYVYQNQSHNNGGDRGLYVTDDGSHNEKNFDIGVNAVPTYSSVNHNSDGSLKYIFGNNGGPSGTNYAGPIGKRVWFFFEDITVVGTDITNVSGRAKFNVTNHDLDTGDYIVVKNYAHWAQVNTMYSGYWYVERIDANSFYLRASAAAGNYCAYLGQPTIKYSLTCGASKMEGINARGSETDKVIITNAPGSQMIFRKNWESTANYGWELFGSAKHVIFTGEYDPIIGTGDTSYRGHRDGYAYSMGKYGIWFMFYNKLTNNPILNIGNGASNWELKFIQIDGGGRGFAGIMMKTDGQPTMNMDDMRIHDCYVSDCEGEGIYFMNTGDNTSGSAPSQHWGKIHLYNNRFCRTGVEILQTGQLFDGSIIENNVAFMSDLTHHKPFFSGQSNFQQIKLRGGKSIVRNNIIMVGAVNNVILQSNRANEMVNDEAIFYNNFYSDGMFRLGFLSQTNAFGGYAKFEKCYFTNTAPYNTDRNESFAVDQNELFLTTFGNQKLLLNNCFFDSSMVSRQLLVGGNTDSVNLAKVTFGSIARPVFKSKSYVGLGDLRNFHEYFLSYKADPGGHHSHAGENIVYTNTDYLTQYALLYKVDFGFSGGNPPATNVNCTQIFFDVNGYNSLHGSYNGTPYSDRPDDDLRLEANDFYNKEHLGLADNEDNTHETQFYWQVAYNDGSNNPDLSFIRDLKMVRDARPLKSLLQKLTRTGVSGKSVMVRRMMVAKNSTTGSLSALKPSNVWLPI